MPRLPPKLLRQAYRINQLLVPLLPVCREIRSARNELRWLEEHAAHAAAAPESRHDGPTFLRQYLARRARGEPLQYLLGTEYFGGLEIKCKPGVLIPRQETAASISHLARLLAHGIDRSNARNRNLLQHGLKLIDLCTGTGCIPLLFSHELFTTLRGLRTVLPKDFGLQSLGADISLGAIRLAETNLEAYATHLQELQRSIGVDVSNSSFDMLHADVLHNDTTEHGSESPRGALPVSDMLEKWMVGRAEQAARFDIMISNPPYISPAAFKKTTSRSVAKFEPKLALVPDSMSSSGNLVQGDIFYPRLWHLAERYGTSVVLFEVGDMEQAKRVASMGIEQGTWEAIEIWKDDPSALSEEFIEIADGKRLTVRGEGHGRSVVAYRSQGAVWLGQGRDL